MEMKYISHKIGKLELRREKNLSTQEHYLEIVEWDTNDNGDYCYSILIFREHEEGFFIESVLDRILVDKEKWKDLGVLIRIGFEFLRTTKERKR